jgi:glutathione synthase/RimK-type ligase-like ATP-grasp enzyme
MIKGLKPISLTDLNLFKDAFARGNRSGWIHYFPLIYLYSLGKNHTILYREDSGSICTFFYKKNLEDPAGGRLAIYFPPAPMNGTALKNAIELVNDYNKSKYTRIVWLDEQEADELGYVSGLKFELNYKYEEYLYNPELYRDMAGKQFARIRNQNNKILKIPNLEILPYTAKYADECLNLLINWETTQGAKYEHFDDRIYTRNCLKYADLFDEKDLLGKVITIDNEIKSFAFGGQMFGDIATWFISKSDHSVTGLNNYILCELFRSLEPYKLINGSSDLGYPGLKFAKESLQPVDKLKIYDAKRVANISIPVSRGEKFEAVQLSKGVEPEFLCNELEGLRKISPADMEKYMEALQKSPQRMSINYFPSLLAAGSSPKASILVGEDSGSLCIYLLQHSPGDNRLHLYLPPMPMDNRVLANCFTKINAYNRDFSGRLLWINESLREEVAALGNIELIKVDQEYLYDIKSFQNLDDGRYKILHAQLAKVTKKNEITAKPFTLQDRYACLEILETWHFNQKNAKAKLEKYSRLKFVILFFDQFLQNQLYGRVYEIKGQVRGFAFGGPIAGEIGCSFLNVTDNDIEGLSYYIWHDFAANMKSISVINAPEDSGFKEFLHEETDQAAIKVESIFQARQIGEESVGAQAIAGIDILKGLKTLAIGDQAFFNRYLSISANTSWISFFPYLYSFAQRNRWALYWELYRGSVCLYCLRERTSGKRLSLYLPPFPFRATTLEYALSKVNQFNNDESGEILWVEESEQQEIARLGYDLRKVADEYFYSKESLDAFLSTWTVAGNVTLRKYTEEDEEACLDVLARWRTDCLDQGITNTGYYYKRSCIKNSLKYMDGSIIGEVLLVDGKIQSVCFAGSAIPQYVTFFVTIASPEYNEMKLFQQASMARNFSAQFFNNSVERDDETAPYLSDEVLPAKVHGLYSAKPSAATEEQEFELEARNINASIYILAARRLGLDVNVVSALNSYCVISKNKKKLYVYHNATSETNVACRRMTNNKFFSQNLLRAGGIPVPDAKIFRPEYEDKIIRYVEKNSPVVIKPIVGSNSIGVTVDPRTPEEVRAALSLIKSGKIMVEHFIPGEDYRILIHNGRVIEVLLWVPPYVVGNGLDSLHILTEIKNEYNRDNKLDQIVVDFDHLHQQGFDLGYVPDKGQRVFLHHLSEPYVGGETIKVDLQTIHPDNMKMFVRAAELSGLVLAGLDFRSENLSIPFSKNGACVNEINSTPHLWPHYFCEQRKDLSSVKAILEDYFSEC